MKTRLLKKVRKRYSIVRYDELPTNPVHYLKSYYIDCGLPFYILYDKHELAYGSKTFDGCYNRLKLLIDLRWRDKIKKTEGKSKKVWW